MSKNMRTVREAKYSITPSLEQGKYFWSVRDANGCVLTLAGSYGWTDTFDHASRAVRNFIKNNQNKVYG